MANPTVGTDRRVPGHSIQQWAVDLITAINGYGFHIPINATTVGIFVTWANTESGGYNPGAPGGRNNPLNTTETSQGGVSGQGGSQGNIADFATYADGIRNQAYNLARAGGAGDSFGYRRIIGALQAVPLNAGAVFSAINSSSFGTHFGPGTTPSSTNVPPASGAGGSGGGSGQAGGSDQQAILSSSLIGDVLGSLPILGPYIRQAQGIASIPERFYDLFVGILSNWKYVLEVIMGFWLFVAGAVIILIDTRAVRTAGTAAAGAAL